MPQEPQSETSNSFEHWLQLLEQREVYVKECPLDYILLSTKERSDLCDKVRTLERELGEANQKLEDMESSFDLRYKADMRAIKLWREAGTGRELKQPDHADLVVFIQQELTKANERIAILEKECQQNNQAACLFDRDTVLAELEQVRGELGIVTNDRNGMMAVNEKHRATISELAKPNHKMREALTELAHVSYLPSRDGARKLPTYGQMVKSIADEALKEPDTSSLIVLTRAEVEKLPCSCKKHIPPFSAEVIIKCPRCLILERFTK